MATSAQTATGALGAGLLAANVWTGPGRHTLSAGLFASDASAAQQQAAHNYLKQMGAVALAILAAVLIAGASRQAGRIMVAALLAIWLLWLINRFAR